jgi:hypothetical protein
VVPAVSGFAERVRHWRPRTPLLPDDLARLVKPDDPDWFAREMAIAAAPPWWFWTFVLRNFSWLVSLFGSVEVSGELPEELRHGPMLLAANHIGDFDPFVVAVALHRLGVVPRIMATASPPRRSPGRCWSGRVGSGSSGAPSWPGTPSASPRSPWSRVATSWPIPRVGWAWPPTAGPSAVAPAWRGWRWGWASR